MKKYIDILRKISIMKFIKYNFCCRQIKREGKVYLIPYKNTILDLDKDAQIVIKGKNLHLGVNRLAGSKAETLLRMEGNAHWNANNGAGICYGTTIELKNNSILNTGYFFLNTGSVIICSRSICIGDNVWFGRNNTVYDNDHHKLLDEKGRLKNPIEPVSIGNNVWITNHISILKGVNIGNNVVISPYSVVRKDIAEGRFVGEKKELSVFNENVRWSPELIE